MKKAIKIFFTITLLLGFVGLFGQTADGGVCLAWTLGSLATCAVSYRVLGKMGVFADNK